MRNEHNEEVIERALLPLVTLATVDEKEFDEVRTGGFQVLELVYLHILYIDINLLMFFFYP
jgi:hypothetical protein